MDENKFEFLEKEQSPAIRYLLAKTDRLEESVRNLQQECQRLYQIGFSNGVEVARKEFEDECKRLEDKGLITCHGFLKPESKEVFDKLAEANVDKFERTNILTKRELYNLMKVTQIDPVEAEYYGQVDKAVKEQTLSDLYPTMHCATGSCGGCNELYLGEGNGCSFKYTCKKKNITILSNITPKPENFAKAFKKE